MNANVWMRYFCWNCFKIKFPQRNRTPALSVQSVCLSISSMLSSCREKKRPPDNTLYVRTCNKNPKKTKWWYHGTLYGQHFQARAINLCSWKCYNLIDLFCFIYRWLSVERIIMKLLTIEIIYTMMRRKPTNQIYR